MEKQNKRYKDNVRLDEGVANGLVVPARVAPIKLKHWQHLQIELKKISNYNDLKLKQSGAERINNRRDC